MSDLLAGIRDGFKRGMRDAYLIFTGQWRRFWKELSADATAGSREGG